MNQNNKTANFGFGKISKEDKVVLHVLRGEICKNMCEYQSLIGFKDNDEIIAVLSIIAVNVCAAYVGELRKENPERFENFIKLVLSDIPSRI